MQSEPPASETERRRLERLLREVVKKLVETGYEKIAEGPENVRQFVSDLRLPKEALALLLAQIDETKSGLYRAVAREIRDFLDHTNLAEELARALTALSFEIKTEVRFIPNDSRLGAQPDVKARVRVKRSDPEDTRRKPRPGEGTEETDENPEDPAVD